MTSKKKNTAELVFVPLGGTGEIGMNCYLYGYGQGPDDHRWMMVDCGISFPDDRHPGVELILPDPAFIAARADRLDGLVLTHAHEDHVGAIPYLWNRFKCPIYATRFTAVFLRRKLQEAGLAGKVPIHEIGSRTPFSVGPFDLEYIPVTHSIPEAQSLAIRTPAGLVIHSGDWKFDPDPVVGPVSDIARFKELGDEGVLAMISDSTNVGTPGHSGSEGSLQKPLTELFSRFERRIAVACFASNVARLATVTRAANAVGRDVALVGRSLWRMHDVARECGYLSDLPPFVREEEAGYLPEDRLLMLVTGSQGEPKAALARIARGEHPNVSLGDGDVCVFSSRVIPGNERSVGRVQNALLQCGVEVVTWRDHAVHVSGHPARDEVAEMYRLTRPKIVIPMHGELMHMDRNAEVAREGGAEQVVIPENGSLIRIHPEPAAQVDTVPTGSLIPEGPRITRLDGNLHRGRKRALFAGTAVITIVVDKEGGLVADPQITAHGLFEDEDEIDAAIDAVGDAIEDALDAMSRKARKDDDAVEDKALTAARKVLKSLTGKRPVTEIHLVRV